MPRTLTTAERALIASGRYRVDVRCEVQDADGAWVDLTGLAGVNWFDGARGAESIDQAVASGTVQLRREVVVGGTTYSLAPLVGASPLNVDALGAYAPLLNPGRGLRLALRIVDPAAPDVVVYDAPITTDADTRFPQTVDGVSATWDTGVDALGPGIPDLRFGSTNATVAMTAPGTLGPADGLVAGERYDVTILMDKSGIVTNAVTQRTTITGANGSWTFETDVNTPPRSFVAPAVEADENGEIQVTFSYTASGTHGVTAFWGGLTVQRAMRPFVDAVIDTVDWQGRASVVTLSWRDVGARLLDQQIETARVYGSEDGVAVEDVMQQILDDNATGVTLAVPESPGWMLRPYEQAAGSLLDALRALALQIGWECRYRWQGDFGGDDDTFALTLYNPERTTDTADDEFGPGEYEDLPALNLALADIRNAVRCYYTDSATGLQASKISEDAASIAAFGRRYMQLAEDASSNIDTGTEAQAMADAARDDLSAPPVEQAMRTRGYWAAALGDVYDFTPNSVHYDETQRYGVVGTQWEMVPGNMIATVQTRGRPAGAYKRWLRAAGDRTGTTADGGLPAPVVGPLLGESSADGGLSGDGACWLPVTFEANTEAVEVYATSGAASPLAAPPLDVQHLAYLCRRQEGDAASADDWDTLLFLATTPNDYRKVYVRAVGRDGRTGLPLLLEARAVDGFSATLGGFSAFAVARAGSTSVLTWTAEASTSPYDVEVLVWRNGSVMARLTPAEAAAGSWTDAGVEPGRTYVYEVQQWTTDGVASALSGPRSSATRTEPTPSDPGYVDPPEWVAGYPLTHSVSGQIQSVEARATCSDTNAATLRLQVRNRLSSGALVWTAVDSAANPSPGAEVVLGMPWGGYTEYRIESADASANALEVSEPAYIQQDINEDGVSS